MPRGSPPSLATSMPVEGGTRYPDQFGSVARDTQLAPKKGEPSLPHRSGSPLYSVKHATGSLNVQERPSRSKSPFQRGNRSPPQRGSAVALNAASSVARVMRAGTRSPFAGVKGRRGSSWIQDESENSKTTQDSQSWIDGMLEATTVDTACMGNEELESRARVQHVDRYISTMEQRIRTRADINRDNAEFSTSYQLFPDCTPPLDAEPSVGPGKVTAVTAVERMKVDLDDPNEDAEEKTASVGGLTDSENPKASEKAHRQELLSEYRDLCRAKGKSALVEMAEPLLGYSSGILACPRRMLGDTGVEAIAAFFSHLPTIHTLDLSDNGIQEHGATALALGLRSMPSLTSLRIDDNKIGNMGARALTGTVEMRACQLKHVSVARNSLGDKSMSHFLQSLVGKKSLLSLDVSSNSLSQFSCEALARILEECTNLKTLDCHWGHIRTSGAVIFAEGLAYSNSLQNLNLAYNGFGDIVPCAALCEALGRDRCSVVNLDLTCNRIGEKAACLLAAKAIAVSLSLELVKLDKNPIGRSGCKRLMAASMGAAGEQQAIGLRSPTGQTSPQGGRSPLSSRDALRAQRKSAERSLEGRDENGDDVRVEISLKDCSANRASGTGRTFNPAEPGGDYEIDLSDPYWRQVVLDMLKVEFTGNGAFERNTVSLNGMLYKLSKLDSFEDDDFLPAKGVLSFRFNSLRKPPSKEDRMDEIIFGKIKTMLLKKGSMDAVELLGTLMSGGACIHIEQALTLIDAAADADRRVEISRLVFHHLVPHTGSGLLLDALSDAERTMLERLVGHISFEFTPNNPSGHHKFHLAVPEERMIAVNLREARCAEGDLQDAFDEGVAKMLGGKRDKLERVWRNSTLDGQLFPFRAHVQIPQIGEIEFDYVQISRPQDTDFDVAACSDLRWSFFLEEIQDTTPEQLVLAFRDLSNEEVFLCKQVRQLLGRFDHTQATFRVELCVTAYSRTLDFHGYYGYTGLWQKCLTIRELAMLKERIGRVNMFSATMAVDYYELDLAVHDERWIMQQLVHLAVKEPGLNCVNETINGIDASIPALWAKEVPNKGTYSCFYCRESGTIDQCIADANRKHPGSVPEDMEFLVETDWVAAAKCSRIKLKMQEKFATPQEGFNQIDRDRGGSIDRRELAAGLFKMGIWLHPTELKTLFEEVDEDDGGDVDLAEFVAFWEKY